MVSVPTCWPARRGARTARVRTASVVPLKRTVRLRLAGAFEGYAAFLIDGALPLIPANRTMPPRTSATTATKMRRTRPFDRKRLPVGCPGGVPSWPNTGPDSVVTSAADEYIQGYSHRYLSADARGAHFLGTLLSNKMAARHPEYHEATVVI